MVLNDLLFLILGWVAVITAIPEMLRLFIKDISNLSRVVGRKFLFFPAKFGKQDAVLFKPFAVVLQGELEGCCGCLVEANMQETTFHD